MVSVEVIKFVQVEILQVFEIGDFIVFAPPADEEFVALGCFLFQGEVDLQLVSDVFGREVKTQFEQVADQTKFVFFCQLCFFPEFASSRVLLLVDWFLRNSP